MQEGAVLGRIETGFKKCQEAGSSVKVAVGDVLAGEQKDFLVEVDLPGLSAPDVTLTVLELRVRYLDVCHACMREANFEAQVLRTADTAGLRESHPIVLVSCSTCLCLPHTQNIQTAQTDSLGLLQCQCLV